MTALLPYRFKLLASMTALLMLSACQPTTVEDTQEEAEPVRIDDIAPPVDATPDAAADPHAGHDMSAMDVTADASETEMLKDYKKSMTRMHDEMMIGMNYNDPDTAFAKGMLGHHRGAVDMAKIELKYGTDPDMRALAEDIISTQQSEIAIMNKWLASHPDSPKPKPDTQAMQEAYAKGMEAMHGDMMLGVADPLPDMAFVRGMLPHHVGAVDMAMVQLKYGTDEDMRALAQQIIDAQQPEIELMQDWIAMHGADNPHTKHEANNEALDDAPITEGHDNKKDDKATSANVAQ